MAGHTVEDRDEIVRIGENVLPKSIEGHVQQVSQRFNCCSNGFSRGVLAAITLTGC
jgi:hypothetical protein